MCAQICETNLRTHEFCSCVICETCHTLKHFKIFRNVYLCTKIVCHWMSENMYVSSYLLEYTEIFYKYSFLEFFYFLEYFCVIWCLRMLSKVCVVWFDENVKIFEYLNIYVSSDLWEYHNIDVWSDVWEFYNIYVSSNLWEYLNPHVSSEL